MSCKGDCWDNAVAESFFKTLKVELIYQNKYETRKQAELYSREEYYPFGETSFGSFIKKTIP